MLVSHSWGDTVVRYFFAFVGATDPGWVERHVVVVVNIAGPSLGVPKSIPAFLSGKTFP